MHFFSSLCTKTIETRYTTWCGRDVKKMQCKRTPSPEWLDVSHESLHSTPLQNQPIFVLIATSTSNKRVSLVLKAQGREEWRNGGQINRKRDRTENWWCKCEKPNAKRGEAPSTKIILQTIFRAKRFFTAFRISNKPTDSAKKTQQKLVHFAPYPSFWSLPPRPLSALCPPFFHPHTCYVRVNGIKLNAFRPPWTTHTHTKRRLHIDELRIQFVHGRDYALFSAVATGFTSILFRLRLCFFFLQLRYLFSSLGGTIFMLKLTCTPQFTYAITHFVNSKFCKQSGASGLQQTEQTCVLHILHYMLILGKDLCHGSECFSVLVAIKIKLTLFKHCVFSNCTY